MSAKNTLIAVFEDIHQQYDWAIAEHHFAPKQDILVEDDEDDDDVYLIRSGKATVIIGGGSEIILGQGDLIGEMSFLLSNKRTASIVAKEPVHCWSVSVSSMEEVFRQDPPLAARFYKALGGLLALRLVNSSKRAIQNQVFQDNDDALISLMEVQASEIQDRLQNYVRVLRNEAVLEIDRVKKEIGRLDVETTEGFQERREQINGLTSELRRKQHQHFEKARPKLEHFFTEIQQMLMEILDLENRNEVGARAFAIFARSVLGEIPFLQLRTDQSLEAVDVMLHIFHRKVASEIWSPRDLILDWIDRVLWEMPTFEAFRARHDLTADVINQHMSIEDSALNITLVYDSIGVVLAKIINTAARSQSRVNMVYTDPKTVYQIQFALTGRMGQVDINAHRLPSLLSTVIGEASLLPNDVPLHSQNLIVISGLINYLPDRYLVQLMSRAEQFLSPTGSILLSGVLPTEDQALFNDFFQWPMIRRSDEEISRLLTSLGFVVDVHIRKNGVVVQAKNKRSEH